MRLLGGLAAMVCGFLLTAVATGHGDDLTLRLPGRQRRARMSRRVWLRQAGAPVSPAGFWAVSALVGLVVELIYLAIVGSAFVGLVPALAAGAGPRLFWGRRRAARLAKVVESWPDGIRNLLSHVATQGSMHAGLQELARTGPEPLRETFSRYDELTRLSDPVTALETIREELADPTSDGIIEMLIVGIDQGQALTLTILHDQAEQVTEDLRVSAEIRSVQHEPRLVARVAFLMPYGALAMLCASVPSYRGFYSSRAGAVATLIAGACSLLGLLIVRRLAQETAEPRVLGGAEIAAPLLVPSFSAIAMMVRPQAVPWGACAGVAVGALVYAASRPWRRLGPRTSPYTVGVRSRLGGQRDQMLALVAPQPTAAGTIRGVLGPIVTTLSRRFMAVFGYRSYEDLRLALVRAGIHDVTPRSYAYQQLTYGAIGIAVGFALGLTQGGQAAVLLAAGGGFVGSTRKYNELEKRTKKRAERIRLELLLVSRVMAVYARATPNLQAVVARVVQRMRGEVAGELAGVLASIQSGTAPEAAFAAAADLTPEPGAARLYQTLAVAITAGGDIAEALLHQAVDLRDRWRDERKAAADRRTVIMVASNASLLVIPMLILVGAAIFYEVIGSV